MGKVTIDSEKLRFIIDSLEALLKQDKALTYGRPDINSIMDIYSQANLPQPSIKNQRRYCKLLIDKVGADKALAMAVYGVQIAAEPYAPVAVTPKDLYNNMAKVIAHKKRQQVGETTKEMRII